MKRKINRKKFHEQISGSSKLQGKKSAGSRFHELNQFHEEKNQFKSFNKSKINMQKVSRIKISTQQMLRTEISTQQVSLIKSGSRGEKSICKLHEEKNRHATSFTNKNDAQQFP